MKYNFSRALTFFIIVFFVFYIKAQDSLSLNNAPASVDSNAVKSETTLISANAAGKDTPVDGGAVKSDTVSTVTETSETAIVKKELIDSVLLMLAESAAKLETLEAMQKPLAEPESTAAVSEKVSPPVPELSENDEKSDMYFCDTGKERIAQNRLLRWVKARLLYLFFLLSSVIIIISAVFFLSAKKDGRRFLTTTRLSVLDKMVQKGCRYIESNYMNPELSVETVCGELVTGATYLNAVFVKEIGITAEDFIIQVRVNNIKNLIAENPAEPDLNKICGQCGFKNSAEAQEHFVKLYGMGIVEYRNSLPRSA